MVEEAENEKKVDILIIKEKINQNINDIFSSICRIKQWWER